MHSLVAGATEPPLLDHTIGQALDIAVQRWSNAEALVSCHQERRLTWSELNEAASAFGRGLLELGIRPGDRVGVWAPNCVEWTVAQFGTARAGIIQVNINPAYRTAELEYTLAKVGVKALLCVASFKTSDYLAMLETVIPDLEDRQMAASTGPLPHFRRAIKIGGEPRAGWLDFEDVISIGASRGSVLMAETAADLTPGDPINIQFTSGTTGLPKGATLSHRNILNNAYFVGLAMGLREGDRLCVPVPLYHCFGMVMSNLACLVHGATMVYPAASFEPLSVLKAVERERCTALHGVPTMFIAQLEHEEFDRFDKSSLRTGIMAGAPCPIEVMNNVMSRMHMRDVGIAYGMTETSPVSFQTAVDDPVERRVSTIGRVQPHLEVKIVDPVSGAITERGSPGEICTRGYSVMLGYWDDPEKTSEVLRGGWMHTGDLGEIDGEGYARIVGRIKDMIIRGGENIYPREIEEFLHSHPSVEDVQVIGVPDPRYGEEVCACIKLRAGHSETETGMIEFCRDKIAHYKLPRYVRFVDAFPMTVTGKIQKYLLRESTINDLELD